VNAIPRIKKISMGGATSYRKTLGRFKENNKATILDTVGQEPKREKGHSKKNVGEGTGELFFHECPTEILSSPVPVTERKDQQWETEVLRVHTLFWLARE